MEDLDTKPKYNSWQEVWDAFRNPECEACELHEDAKSVCLMGQGPVPCDYMLIGEAPGKREDDICKPFQGPAGQLLESILQETGLDRDQFYISNTAKCRPLYNRTPTKKEIKTCVDTYLWDEIKAVNPKYIILMGNIALQGVLGLSGITNKRGQEFRSNGRVYLPTLHTAYALRQASAKQWIVDDFKHFRILAGLDKASAETHTRLVLKPKVLHSLIDEMLLSEAVSFDLETEGLDPFIGNRIWCISLSHKDGEAYVIPLEHPSYLEMEWVYPEIKRLLEPKLPKKIGQNAKFDCRWLWTRGVYPYLTFDTMQAAHLLDENRKHDLKSLAVSYLQVKFWGLGDKIKGLLPMSKLAPYSGKDADYDRKLYFKQRAELEQDPRLRRIFQFIVMPACRVLTQVECIGLPLDMGRLNERKEQAVVELEKLREQLEEQAGHPNINWNSTQQLSRVLFEEPDGMNFGMNLPIVSVTETGRPSTAESTLKILQDEDPIIKTLLKYREWQGMYSKYLKPWSELVTEEHPYLHTTYKVEGTVTGRISSENPNLQNVPRDPFIRSIVGGVAGWYFVEADFSQIELRLAAILSDDKNLKRVYLTGQDAHTQMATRVTGLPADKITKEQRKMSKACNFGFIYGMGAKKFREYCRDKFDLKITMDEAHEARDVFFNLYSALPKWHNDQRRIVKNLGYVRSPLGRMRRLPDIYSPDGDKVAEAERQAINCVDSETECLTEEGWKKCNEIRVGDNILTKNPKSNILEWQPIQYLNIGNYTGTAIKIKSRSFDILTTPNHRWLVTKGSHPHRGVRKNELVTSDTLLNAKRVYSIHRQGYYSGNESSPFTDDEVELIGWTVTEGHFKKQYTQKTYAVSLCQSSRAHPDYVKQIDDLFNRLGVHPYKRYIPFSETWYWTYSSSLARRIRTIIPENKLTIAFLQLLTKNQLAILFEIMMKADAGPRRFSSVDQKQADVFQILAVLNGFSTRIFERDQIGKLHKSEKLHNKEIAGVISYQVEPLNRSYLHNRGSRGQKYIQQVLVENRPMWCPTVKNGTWVARRKGYTFITGNSPVQGTAADLTLLAMNILDGQFVDLLPNYQPLNRDEAYIIGTVHDSILFSIREDCISTWCSVIKHTMEHLPLLKLFNWEPDIPIEAGITYGAYWTEGKIWE